MHFLFRLCTKHPNQNLSKPKKKLHWKVQVNEAFLPDGLASISRPPYTMGYSPCCCPGDVRWSLKEPWLRVEQACGLPHASDPHYSWCMSYRLPTRAPPELWGLGILNALLLEFGNAPHFPGVGSHATYKAT